MRACHRTSMGKAAGSLSYCSNLRNGSSIVTRCASASLILRRDRGSIWLANQSSAKYNISQIRTFGFTRQEFGPYGNQFHITKCACLWIERKHHRIIVTITGFIKAGHMAKHADKSIVQNVRLISPAPFRIDELISQEGASLMSSIVTSSSDFTLVKPILPRPPFSP